MNQDNVSKSMVIFDVITEIKRMSLNEYPRDKQLIIVFKSLKAVPDNDIDGTGVLPDGALSLTPFLIDISHPDIIMYIPPNSRVMDTRGYICPDGERILYTFNGSCQYYTVHYHRPLVGS